VNRQSGSVCVEQILHGNITFKLQSHVLSIQLTAIILNVAFKLPTSFLTFLVS